MLLRCTSARGDAENNTLVHGITQLTNKSHTSVQPTVHNNTHTKNTIIETSIIYLREELHPRHPHHLHPFPHSNTTHEVSQCHHTQAQVHHYSLCRSSTIHKTSLHVVSFFKQATATQRQNTATKVYRVQ